MSTSDQYLTIESSSFGEYKDRGSKFLAYAYPATREEEWQLALEAVKKLHPKARHHCYAFRLGQDGNTFRANDDGEPSGSAGRPILGQIDSYGLINIMVIVVRYFGGTKLGVPGLIAAYKGSTKAALDEAAIVEKTVQQVYEFRFPYAIMSAVMNASKKANCAVLRQEFTMDGCLELAFPRSEAAEEIWKFKARVAGVSLEEIKLTDKEIPGLEINFLRTV
ncbi:MAG: YigZ family protein [Bacteroidota bacterium]